MTRPSSGYPASAQRNAAARARPAGGGGSGRRVWRTLATLVFLLPAAAVLLPTTLVIAVTMLPTLAAWLVDRQPGRALAVSVGLLNFAGSLPGILQVWINGHDVAAARWVLSDAGVWLAAYAAAAVGWLLFIVLPPMLRAFYARATARRIRALQRRQEQLEKDWGPEVARDAVADVGRDTAAAGADSGAQQPAG
jgi:hypothetical protein